MSPERILGFIVLLLGLGIILYALISSFQIFTGRIDPPELFSFDEPADIQEATAPNNIQEQVGKLLREQLGEFLPVDVISRTLNISMWSMFAFLLLFGGGQIAGIGIKLLKVRKED
ncbi:hypothetical protein IID24_01505 [Patescibacteria group bacterium]|nr:hypothetical protein [Patescibacteria group bacterium]